MRHVPFAALLALACTKATPSTSADQASMQEHYALVTVARDAVIRGDLALAKEAARGLAAQESPVQPGGWKPLDLEGWQPHHAAMRREASTVAEAPDLATAGRAVARAGAACGGCHAAEGTGPSHLLADVPPQEWREGEQMRLHQWAADWMWLGLIAGSDDAWHKGAAELADAPIAPRWEFDTNQAGFRELEQLVRLVGQRASEGLPEAERVTLYGDFLGVCAQCHLLLRPPPG